MSIMERVSPKTQISPNRMDLYDIKCILEAPPYNQISHPDAESSGNIIKLRFSEKGIYEGEINDNFIPDGKGILYYENGDEYYGEFTNGKREGKGKYYYSDYSIYIGDWENDMKDGNCYFIDVKKRWIYKGYFTKDRPLLDEGTFTYFNEDVNKILEIDPSRNIEEIKNNQDEITKIIWAYFTNKNEDANNNS